MAEQHQQTVACYNFDVTYSCHVDSPDEDLYVAHSFISGGCWEFGNLQYSHSLYYQFSHQPHHLANLHEELMPGFTDFYFADVANHNLGLLQVEPLHHLLHSLDSRKNCRGRK